MPPPKHPSLSNGTTKASHRHHQTTPPQTSLRLSNSIGFALASASPCTVLHGARSHNKKKKRQNNSCHPDKHPSMSPADPHQQRHSPPAWTTQNNPHPPQTSLGYVSPRKQHTSPLCKPLTPPKKHPSSLQQKLVPHLLQSIRHRVRASIGVPLYGVARGTPPCANTRLGASSVLGPRLFLRLYRLLTPSQPQSSKTAGGVPKRLIIHFQVNDNPRETQASHASTNSARVSTHP